MYLPEGLKDIPYPNVPFLITLKTLYVSISALPQYKPIMFYGQGIKTAKGHCTIMSFLRNCTPLPYFSNPYLTFDGEKLGDEFGYVNYNVKWIRQNRFLLQSVGTEGQKCEFTEGSID